MKRILFLFVLLLATTILTSCAGINVTINFDTDGGTEIESINTDGVSSINIPNNPEKEGFVFDGWYWDKGTFLKPFTANSLLDEPISGDLTVHAKWFSESLLTTNFDVIFDVLGGTEINSLSIQFRQSISEPAEPMRLGYLFAGWYKDRNHTEAWNFITDKVESNITLYAKWNVMSEDYHIVHFATNFDMNVPSQQVLKGSALGAPNLSRVGYTLDGWYTSVNNGQTLDERWLFATYVVNTNFTLYAKWTLNQHTITFESNGGSAVNARTRDYGSSITQPLTPFKSGYVFGGWHSDSSLETAFNFDTILAENLTLYAAWLRTFNFDTNGAANINSINLRPGDALSTPIDPTKTGHTFDGWYADVSLTTPFTFGTMPDENITAYAKWNANQYTITFEMNSGDSINNLILEYDVLINITNTPEKIGFSFDGWYLDQDLTVSFDLTKMPAEDLTLYAKWSIDQFVIIFDTDGGSMIDNITQNYQTEVIQPDDPVKEGYTFSGWFSEETLTIQYIFASMPAEDTKVFAKWTINSYVLTLITNTLLNNLEFVVEYGTAIEYQDGLIKEGYTFAGWFLDDLLTTPSAFASMPAFDLTLHAKWAIGISFIPNGGSDVNSIFATPGDSIEQPDNPIKEGYTFVGWFSDQTLDDEYVFSVMPDQSAVLYANWQINQYTITFETYNEINIDPITQDFNSNIIPPLNPVKEGHVFNGWTLDEETGLLYNFESMPAQNIILYAVWEVQHYTISFDAGEESLIEDITQAYQTVIVKPDNPLLQHHKFIGWYEDDGFEILFIFTTMPARDIKIYAKWAINQYRIEYLIVDGENEDSTNVPLNPGEKIISLSLGDVHSSALTSENRVFTWGENGNGQLGDGTTTNKYTPTEITDRFNLVGGEIIVSLTLGYYHSSALTSEGRVFTWGSNWEGRLGDGTGTNKPTISEITHNFDLSLGEKITSLALGYYHSSALTSKGRVFTWGSNNFGQLGDGTTSYKLIPREITGNFDLNVGETITALSLGAFHSSALTSEGRVFTWGLNSTGQLGDDTTGHNKSFPFEITGRFDLIPGEKIINVTLGGTHSSALTSEGRVFTWGGNESGQLGDDTVTYKLIPTEITTHFILVEGEKIISLSLGDVHSSALTSKGRMFSWGSNNFGQLGDNATGHNKLIPTEITTRFNLDEGEKITNIILGGTHSSALTSKGRMFSWGSNNFGQLGDGKTINRATPVLPLFSFPTFIHTDIYNYNQEVFEFIPVLEGHMFSGWYIDIEMTTAYVFTNMPGEDLILYGYWTPIE